MSGAYIDNLKVWTRGDDVRVYISTRYMDYRCKEANADGAFFMAKEDGSVGYRHGFRTGPDTVREAERVHFSVHALIKTLALEGVTFAEFLDRIAACQTKGANFSHRQYEKRYLLN